MNHDSYASMKSDFIMALRIIKALMLRGHGAVVVGQSIREVCMLGLFLKESARLQTEAMRLGTPMFMERDEAEKIAKRTFKPTSVERAWEHFAAKCAG
jgi:3-hydroxy-2-methylpyridine-4,5-dicarboxylate 4-decarboxylase